MKARPVIMPEFYLGALKKMMWKNCWSWSYYKNNCLNMVAEILLSGERMMGYEPVKGTIAPGRRAILKGPKGERVEVNCHPSNTQTVVEISLSDGTESRRVVLGKGET